MKVLLVTDAMNESKGLGVYSECLCQNLTKISENVGCISLKKTTFLKLPYKVIKPLDVYLLFPFLLRKVTKKNSGETVIHFLHPELVYLKFFVKRKFKTMVTIHDLAPLDLPHETNLPNNMQKIFYYNFKELPKLDKIIAISSFTKERLIKYGINKDKIVVVYNGVRKEFLTKKKGEKNNLKKKYGLEGKTILLNVGSEIPRKNVELLIMAFYFLRQKYPNLKLIRIGSPSQQNKTVIDCLNLEKDVSYYSNLSLEQLIEFYDIADIFVFPSKYEGFGLSLVEALARGLPIVCGNNSAVSEVVGDAAIKLETNSLHKCLREWINAIDFLIHNKEKRKELGSKGKNRARKFSWEVTATKLIKVYRELTDEKGGNPSHTSS